MVNSYSDYHELKKTEFAFGRLLDDPRNAVLNALMVYHIKDWEESDDG